ncbi:MAG: cyclase family protein [Dehalococcoidia bacterium]|nr:cyclase family protein [Dehalococcoidia bacterium]
MKITTDEALAEAALAASNWGRWGPDDELGTLNYLTAERRRHAVGLAKSGRVVSLSRETKLDAASGIPRASHDVFRYPGGGSGDYIGLVFHGHGVTHIDALCHIFARGQMYNGYSDEAVLPDGATKLSIDRLGPSGIVGRGVLLDVARVKGGPLPQSTPILPQDLEAAEQAQGLSVGEGDILFVRSGTMHEGVGEEIRSPGLHADCIPWLFQRRVAVLGGDNANDLYPSGFKRWRLPIHVAAIMYMGLHLVDNADLEPISAACAEEGRWEFLLTIAPLRFKGTTGSPVNPLAIF